MPRALLAPCRSGSRAGKFLGMAHSLRLEARLGQSLTLTPQLMQSIKLLQLSHLELNQFVEAELLRNPLLERDDVPAEPTELTEQGAEEIETDGLPDTIDGTEAIATTEAIADTLDSDAADIFPEQVGSDSGQYTPAPDLRGPAYDAEAPDLERFVSSRPSLAEHLAEQISLLLRDPAERLVARHLIDNLNEAGYLAADIEAIAGQLGADLELVRDVLKALRGCDPVGVFATGVADCLAMQLEERDRLDPMMQALLDNLDLLARHDLPALARAVGASAEDLADMIEEIRQLDPRPGLAFDGAPVQTVVPDVFVRRGNDDAWTVELNSDVLPRVLVNRTYYATVSKRTRDPGERRFLSDCLQSASWLTKSLDQRAQTILKVATEIVRQQDGFLTFGVEHLRPMTLKAVADAIEMHESTVSRVTANKYVATPRGLFEMKYFFTTALASTSGGEEHSAEAVRHRIRQLIDAEQGEILSDDTIADLLNREQGIGIARRTVAKYREAMNIPSSVIRRRQKRLAHAN